MILIYDERAHQKHFHASMRTHKIHTYTLYTCHMRTHTYSRFYFRECSARAFVTRAPSCDGKTVEHLFELLLLFEISCEKWKITNKNYINVLINFITFFIIINKLLLFLCLCKLTADEFFAAKVCEKLNICDLFPRCACVTLCSTAAARLAHRRHTKKRF